MRTVLLYLLIPVFLIGCGDTSTLPINQPPGQQPPTTPPTSGPCAVTIVDDISVPTTFVNTASDCDYLLQGFIEVTSTLVIEPGVVIQAAQDTRLRVDGGQILAVGTPNARITFEGVNHIAGYWSQIGFIEGRESRFEYVDIKDAGQVCTDYAFCPDAAFVLGGVTLSFTNSTISNSYVHGLYTEDNVLFTKFENNRFYNNVWAGVVIDGNYVPVLDAASDYVGGAEPNGTPYVVIGGGRQSEGKEFRWKKLNAPYLIADEVDFGAYGGTLILDPGVEMVFGKDGGLTIDGNGVLKAIGTAAAPIIFRGLVEQPGYWDGITIWDSPWEGNELSYVQMRHSGSTGAGLPAEGAVSLRYNSRININNSVISDNAQYGVTCDEQSDYVGSPVLVLGLGNTFSNNGSGDVDPDCGDAAGQ